ncbi:hypothetical protein BLA29_002931, partial [Euroglyphus maynei]
MTNISSTPTTISSISGIIGSSAIATSISSNTLVATTPTFLNSAGIIPLTSLATTGGVQGLIFAGSQLTTNATSNVQSIRHPSTSTTAFVSAPQFQLGQRPMTVLPQPFILPGGLQLSNGSNNPNAQQFVFARPSLSSLTAQHHPSAGTQLLQIIQTSQGPQLITSTSPLQTFATSNNVQTINVQQQQTSTILTTPTTSATTSKNSKGSNKQILPKPNSAKNSKTTHHQNSQNIKFIQTPAAVGGGATNPGATQFLLGGSHTTGNVVNNHQPQVIAGPNGTFFLSNNIVQTNAGPTQFATQPQLIFPNQQLLALRPSGSGSLAGQTFLVNPNALTAANNINNNSNDQVTLNQLTIPHSSPSIINT